MVEFEPAKRRSEILSRSPYGHLLEDQDVKRWFSNVRRGSLATACEWVKRVGWISKEFGVTPQALAKMSQKEATNFLLDMVTTLEERGYSTNYISNLVKPVKNWLDFNQIQLLSRIKIHGRAESKYSDERVPTPQELKKILDVADLRKKIAIAIMAFTGIRIEVLGNYDGSDGLELRDFPEMLIDNRIEFTNVPTRVLVRETISKAAQRYESFLCEEGCDLLGLYLEARRKNGERLEPKTSVIAVTQKKVSWGKSYDNIGKHMRSQNISELLLKPPIKQAGFTWRPYVLRRYFDTRMMMAESDGLLIPSWRSFWMGHKGDIEAVYTVNKGLSKDVVERMREAYGKAAEKYLETSKKKQGSDEMLARMNRQFLAMTGYSEKEIEALGDLSEKTEEEMQQLVKQRQMAALGLNGNSQKVIQMTEVKSYVAQGWEYVTKLPNSEAVIRLPTKF